MHTVKVNGPGSMVFKGRQVRLPAEFKNLSDKDLKLLKVMCHHANVNFEIIGAESKRLASVAKKLSEAHITEEELKSIDDTDIEIEDLFTSDDSLGKLLGNLDKEK